MAVGGGQLFSEQQWSGEERVAEDTKRRLVTCALVRVTAAYC